MKGIFVYTAGFHHFSSREKFQMIVGISTLLNNFSTAMTLVSWRIFGPPLSGKSNVARKLSPPHKQLFMLFFFFQMDDFRSRKKRHEHDYESSMYEGTTSSGGDYSSTYGAYSAVSSDSGSYPFINDCPTVASTSTAPPVGATGEHRASSYHPNDITMEPYETDDAVKSASSKTYGFSVVKPTSYFTTVESKSNWSNVTPVTRHVRERSDHTSSRFSAETRSSTSSVTRIGLRRHLSDQHESSTKRQEVSHDGNQDGRRQVVKYNARGGGRVVIFVPLNPWQVLGFNSSDASHEAIKAAFKEKIHQPVRQNRALVSIAYHMLTSSAGRYKRVEGTNEFVVARDDYFMLAACGHTDELTLRIAKDGNIVQQRDEHGRTLLYMASKSGFYDTCNLLLQKGADVNEAQGDGSTPLHGAAYFGHELVVGLLLQHGAKSDIRNQWGNTAVDESATPRIRNLIQTASVDYISSLAAKLKEKQLVKSVRLIEYQGEVIAKELTRDPRSLDALTRDELNNIQNTWEIAWHGTRYRYLKSIIDNGLLPSGTCGIKPAKGHYKLGETHFGIQDWAAAIFLSPCILYASHVCYSERIFSESKRWCVLVKVYCKPGSFKSYDPTVFRYEPMDGEPDMPEYRIPVTEADKNVILRVESTRNVVVQSLIFVRLSFLENQNINFEQAMKLLR